MIEVRQTEEFVSWFKDLTDERAQARIAARLRRLAFGLMGDVKPVGEGVHELRIDVGAGYRVYFITHGQTLVLILCGGDKRRQERDIKRAKEMAAKLKKVL